MSPPQKQFPVSFYCTASLLLFLAVTTPVQAQYTYTINNGLITITGYTGPGGAVIIPTTINGWSVTVIGDHAFYDNTSLTSVIIPDSVTTIGDWAFQECINLTNVSIGNSVTGIGLGAFQECTSLTSVIIPDSVTSIGLGAFATCTSLNNFTVGAANISYSSDVAGVLFNKDHTTLIQCPGGKTGTYLIPDSVASIGDWAFANCTSLTCVIIPDSVINIGSEAFAQCTSLTGVIIPDSVTSIGWGAFQSCTSLTSVYFKGDAISVNLNVFGLGSNPTVYYLPGTTGWGPTLGGRPTVLWNPQAETRDGSFGIMGNQFGFNITGTSDLVVVVEACTSLANPIWSAVGTNTLTSGSSYFSDSQWADHPGRFYRLRSP